MYDSDDKIEHNKFVRDQRGCGSRDETLRPQKVKKDWVNNLGRNIDRKLIGIVCVLYVRAADRSPKASE